MFCAYCGREISKDERFCAYCGQANDSSAVEETVAPQPEFSFIPPVTAAPDPIHLPLYPTESPAPVAPAYEAPAAVAYQPEPQPAAPVKRKKRAKPVIITILALVLVAALAVAGFMIFGKKTVYLVTKTVVNNGSYTSTTRYDYDEDGRLTKIKYDYEYSYDTSFSDGYEIAYSYNDDGTLKYCTFKQDGEILLKIEYTYKSGTLSGLKIKDAADHMEDQDIEADCNSDGQLEYVALLDEDGEPYIIYEFKYHDNGIIKKYTYTYDRGSYGREMESHYNEDGKLIEQTYSYDGEQSWRYVYDYDEEGRQILQESYDADDELQSRTKMDYSFKKSLFKPDKLTGLTITTEGRTDDGDLQEVVITLACEWDGNECTLTVEDIDGDREAIRDLEESGFDEDTFKILLEFDENNNLLKSKVFLDDDNTQTTTYTYEEVKVPRKYRQIDPENDPMYLYFLLNS